MKIPQIPVVKLPKEDITKLLCWKQDFGRGVRQQAIRSAYTKDKPGTLPLYMCRVAPANHEDVDIQIFASSDSTGETDLIEKDDHEYDQETTSNGESEKNPNLKSLRNEFVVLLENGSLSLLQLAETDDTEHVCGKRFLQYTNFMFQSDSSLDVMQVEKSSIVSGITVSDFETFSNKQITLSEETYCKYISITRHEVDIDSDVMDPEVIEEADHEDNFSLLERKTRKRLERFGDYSPADFIDYFFKNKS